MSPQAAFVWLATPFLVSLLTCRLMITIGPGDAPDGHRKTQARVVPSGGGVGIIAGLLAPFVLAMSLAAWQGGNAAMAWPPGWILTGVLLCGLVGLADDSIGLGAGLKLIVLTGICLASAVYGPPLAGIWLPGAGEAGIALPEPVSLLLVTSWLLIMANATNFMDGANGIASGSAAIMLAASAGLVHGPAGDTGLLMLLAAVAGLSGFLVWNLQGRLYAGDTGSLSVGFLIGAAGGLVSLKHSVWVAGLLVLPFLVDVFMTLLWRARRGAALMQPHRDHAYQLLLRAGWSHLQVAALWWLLSAVCAGLSLAGAAGGPAVSAAVFGGALMAGCLAWTWQRVALKGVLAELNRPG